MFGPRYFANRYFGGRYWGRHAHAATVSATATAVGQATCRAVTPLVRAEGAGAPVRFLLIAASRATASGGAFAEAVGRSLIGTVATGAGSAVAKASAGQLTLGYSQFDRSEDRGFRNDEFRAFENDNSRAFHNDETAEPLRRAA